MVLFLLFALSGAPSLATGDAVNLPTTAADPTVGPARAPIVLIELTDYQCPYCRASEPYVQKLLADYKDRIRFIHKDFPLDIHSQALPAAGAARCAGEQGHFWAMRRALLNPKLQLSEESIAQAAVSLHLEKGPFDACVASRKYEAPIMAGVKQAVDLGFHTTPSFVVNGHVILGSQVDLLRQAVKDALPHP